MPHGTLFLIVGPSGAGKDTLIDAVRTRLPAETYRFPRRTITRPPGPGEDHHPTDLASFEAAERSGAFALSWRAHGLAYGIDAEIAAQLANGINIVANVSRTVVDQARTKFDRVRVIEITAPDSIRGQRLKARGREDKNAVEERLDRHAPATADVTIVNDGALDQALAAFAAALQG